MHPYYGGNHTPYSGYGMPIRGTARPAFNPRFAGGAPYYENEFSRDNFVLFDQRMDVNRRPTQPRIPQLDQYQRENYDRRRPRFNKRKRRTDFSRNASRASEKKIMQGDENIKTPVATIQDHEDNVRSLDTARVTQEEQVSSTPTKATIEKVILLGGENSNPKPEYSTQKTNDLPRDTDSHDITDVISCQKIVTNKLDQSSTVASSTLKTENEMENKSQENESPMIGVNEDENLLPSIISPSSMSAEISSFSEEQVTKVNPEKDLPDNSLNVSDVQFPTNNSPCKVDDDKSQKKLNEVSRCQDHEPISKKESEQSSDERQALKPGKNIKTPIERKIAPKLKKFDLVGSILQLGQKKKVSVERLPERRTNPVGDRSLPGHSTDNLYDISDQDISMIRSDGQAKIPLAVTSSASFQLKDLESSLSEFLTTMNQSSDPLDFDKLHLISGFEIKTDEEAEAVKKIIEALAESIIHYETCNLPPDISEIVKESILLDIGKS